MPVVVESLPAANLRLLQSEIGPKVCEALKGITKDGQPPTILETEAYDSRVRVMIEACFRPKLPDVGEKSRSVFYFDTGLCMTYLFLDRNNDGTWKPINLEHPIILVQETGGKIILSKQIPELTAAVKVLDDFPRDPRAEAAVDKRPRSAAREAEHLRRQMVHRRRSEKVRLGRADRAARPGVLRTRSNDAVARADGRRDLGVRSRLASLADQGRGHAGPHPRGAPGRRTDDDLLAGWGVVEAASGQMTGGTMSATSGKRPHRLGDRRVRLVLEVLERRDSPAFLVIESFDPGPIDHSGPVDVNGSGSSCYAAGGGVEFAASARAPGNYFSDFPDEDTPENRDSSASVTVSGSATLRIDPDASNGEQLDDPIGVYFGGSPSYGAYGLQGMSHSFSIIVAGKQLLTSGEASGRSEDGYSYWNEWVPPTRVVNMAIGDTFIISVFANGGGTPLPDEDSRPWFWGDAPEQGNFQIRVSTWAITGPTTGDIKMKDATTTDLQQRRRIKFTYEVSEQNLSGSFQVAAYRSADAYFDPGDKDFLIAQSYVSKPALLTVGEHTIEEKDFRAPKRVDIDKQRPFIVLVADPENSLPETDEENNSIFVIPLLANTPKQYAGYDPRTGNFKYRVPEKVASGQILPRHKTPTVASLGYISRGTDAFNRLQSLDPIWSTVYGFLGRFKDEEPQPYLGDDFSRRDDHLVDPALLAPFGRFTTLILLAEQQERIPAAQFYVITDAFDEQNEHNKTKPEFDRRDTHFEGRGVDITATTVESFPKLCGLALLAGFDWVFNEYELNHFHVSSRGGAADISISDLAAAVTFGADNGLIRIDIADVLQTRLSAIKTLTNQINSGFLTPAELRTAKTLRRREVQQFIADVKEAYKKGAIIKWLKNDQNKDQLVGIAPLLAFNANELLKTY